MSWTLNNDYNPDVVDETGKVICAMHGYGTPEGQWNARLICAAPEMYRLLTEIVDYGLLLDEVPVDKSGAHQPLFFILGFVVGVIAGRL